MQTPHQRRCTDGKPAHETTLHIVRRWGNTNAPRHHHTPTKNGPDPERRGPQTLKDVERQERSGVAGGNAEWRSHVGRRFGGFLGNQTCSYHATQHSCSYSPKGVEDFRPHRNLPLDVCSCFSPNHPNLEATETSFSRGWISGSIRLHNGLVFRATKK